MRENKKFHSLTKILNPGGHFGRANGFTMVELAVTLAIASIVMFSALNGYRYITKHHAAEELTSELRAAGKLAVKRCRPVTATFNFNTTRCVLSWGNDAGGIDTKTIDFGKSARNEAYFFDPNPPGGATPPDAAFVFSALGFISTIPGGNVGGNVYLRSEDNSLWYQIQTTIAGGIDLRRYNHATGQWDRPR